jgi:hypothetical protein
MTSPSVFPPCAQPKLTRCLQEWASFTVTYVMGVRNKIDWDKACQSRGGLDVWGQSKNLGALTLTPNILL